MNIEILRGELERLYSLEELCTLAEQQLGLKPEDVGGNTVKASFARALTERCVDTDRIEALLDVLMVSKKEIDPRVRDVASLLGEAEIPPGKSFGPYTIDKKLGASEMGVVYQAKREGAVYILKTLRREASRDRRAVHRFLTANRLVAGVKHDGIPKHIDAGEHDDTFFVAYENVDAQPLSARFARTGPSHINELKPILKATLEALGALHKAGLFHGDLKMDHVLLARGAEPQSMRAWLIDFGGDRLRPRMSPTTGSFGFLAVFGSPKTIAPEQVRGKQGDARTDVYAFGALLYKALAGSAVFPVSGAPALIHNHLNRAPESLRARVPDAQIPKAVDEVVLRCLAKAPADRFASMRDVASALRAAADDLGALPSFEFENVDDDLGSWDKTRVAPPSFDDVTDVDETRTRVRPESASRAPRPLGSFERDKTTQIAPSMAYARGPVACGMCRAANPPGARACVACGVSLAAADQHAIASRVRPVASRPTPLPPPSTSATAATPTPSSVWGRVLARLLGRG